HDRSGGRAQSTLRGSSHGRADGELRADDVAATSQSASPAGLESPPDRARAGRAPRDGVEVRQSAACGPPAVITAREDEPVPQLAVLQNRPNPITGPISLAAPYNDVIARALERGLSAQRIWQDLVGRSLADLDEPFAATRYWSVRAPRSAERSRLAPDRRTI